MSLINELLSIALSAAPWLLLGLVIAGLIKALMPEHLLQRWMGGRGLGSILRAAVIGMPLPLCSCGAIPTALALHRGGAGRGPTTSFLIQYTRRWGGFNAHYQCALGPINGPGASVGSLGNCDSDGHFSGLYWPISAAEKHSC